MYWGIKWTERFSSIFKDFREKKVKKKLPAILGVLIGNVFYYCIGAKFCLILLQGEGIAYRGRVLIWMDCIEGEPDDTGLVTKEDCDPLPGVCSSTLLLKFLRKNYHKILPGKSEWLHTKCFRKETYCAKYLAKFISENAFWRKIWYSLFSVWKY